MTAAENQLIAGLPRRERQSLLAVCRPVSLELGAVLCDPGEQTQYVYFPIDGFISLVAAVDGEPRLEVGMVGREGMLGAQVVLGVSGVPLHALVQCTGMAHRVTTTQFRRQLSAGHTLRGELARYVCVLMMQLATSAGCTRFHDIGARLARWLLMSQDRAHAASFHLTHEFLAYMLGVRRVGITKAASDLQRRGLVRYHRGEITVLDRAGLEATACSCYAADCSAYVRTLGHR